VISSTVHRATVDWLTDLQRKSKLKTAMALRKILPAVLRLELAMKFPTHSASKVSGCVSKGGGIGWPVSGERKKTTLGCGSGVSRKCAPGAPPTVDAWRWKMVANGYHRAT
jgi:hypothetical protein